MTMNICLFHKVAFVKIDVIFILRALVTFVRFSIQTNHAKLNHRDLPTLTAYNISNPFKVCGIIFRQDIFARFVDNWTRPEGIIPVMLSCWLLSFGLLSWVLSGDG